MAPRPCLAPGCPHLSRSGGTYCTTHERARLLAKVHRRRSSPGDGAAQRYRRLLNRRGSGYCRRCGLPFLAAALRVDHVVPLVDGGHDTDDNVQALCAPCHRLKSTEEGRARRKFGA